MTKVELLKYISSNYISERQISKIQNILYECPYCGTTGGHNFNCQRHTLNYCRNSTAQEIVRGVKNGKK